MEILDLSLDFYSDWCKLSGKLVTPGLEKQYPGVLFLHGGGKFNGKNIFTGWQKFLGQRGYASLAFDFRGVGDPPESEGVFEENSLAERLRDSSSALTIFSRLPCIDNEKLAVLGTSMGGHVAARLTENSHQIKALVLDRAAAYAQEAESLKFNNGFSDAIRKEGSWINSPAFDAIEKFKKPLLAIYGDSDEVIPKGIQEKYGSFASQTGGLIIIQDAGHHFSKSPDGGRKVYEEAYQKSYDFLEKYLK